MNARDTTLSHTLRDMSHIVSNLHRIGRSLNALAALATSGDPSSSNLGVISSEDLGALLGTLGDSALQDTTRLDRLVGQAIQASQHP